VITGGVEEKHPEGKYFLNFNNRWIDAGEDALVAQRKHQMRLAQIEDERLGGRAPVTDEKLTAKTESLRGAMDAY
jgi:hypothetical protein